jgi:hypothetical protein
MKTVRVTEIDTTDHPQVAYVATSITVVTNEQKIESPGLIIVDLESASALVRLTDSIQQARNEAGRWTLEIATDSTDSQH